MKAVIPSGDLTALLKVGCSPLNHDPVKDPDVSGYGRIQYSDGRLVVESSSMTMAAKSVVDCQGEEGYCCLELQALADMLKVMPDGENAVLEYSGTKLNMKVGKSQCSFACLDPDTIAPLGSPASAEVSIKAPLEGLVKSIAAASVSGEANDADGVRSNVLFQSVNGALLAVATDNIRCSIVPVPAECFKDFRGVVPIKGAKALRTFDCEEILVAEFGESLLFLDGTGGFIQFQQSQQALKSFPDFTVITGINHIDALNMSTERFTTVMAGAHKINPQECVMVVEDGEIIVSNVRPVDGAEYRGATAYDGTPGYDIKIGLCPLLIIEYLKTLKSDSLTLSFSPERNSLNSPSHILIRDGDGSLFFVKSLLCLVDVPTL